MAYGSLVFYHIFGGFPRGKLHIAFLWVGQRVFSCGQQGVDKLLYLVDFVRACKVIVARHMSSQFFMVIE